MKMKRREMLMIFYGAAVACTGVGTTLQILGNKRQKNREREEERLRTTASILEMFAALFVIVAALYKEDAF
jgi:hypothetical protein